MINIWSFFLIILNIINISAINYVEKFVSNVQHDEMSFVAINIPRYAQKVSLSIKVDKSISNKYDFIEPPYVYLRYDGIPSLDNYDTSYQLPESTYTIELNDNKPTQSVLYLGLWGGALLHSYRYFAGKPDFIFVDIETTIQACDSSFQYGPDCIMMPMIGILSQHNLQINDIPSYFGLNLPNGLESFSIESLVINSNSNDLDNICSHYYLPTLSKSMSISISLKLFLDQEDDEENSGSRLLNILLKDLCDKEKNLEFKFPTSKLNIKADYPMIGLWKVQLSIKTIDLDNIINIPIYDNPELFPSSNKEINKNKLFKRDLNNNNKRNSNRFNEQRNLIINNQKSNFKSKNKKLIIVDNDNLLSFGLTFLLKVTLDSCPSGYTGYNEEYTKTTQTFYSNGDSISSEPPIKSIERCTTPITPMVSTRDSSSNSRGYATFISDTSYIRKHWINKKTYNNFIFNKIDSSETIKKNITIISKYQKIKEDPHQTSKLNYDDVINNLNNPLPYAVFSSVIQHSNTLIGGGLQIVLNIKPVTSFIMSSLSKSTQKEKINSLNKESHFLLSMRCGNLPNSADIAEFQELFEGESYISSIKNKTILSNGELLLSTRDAIFVPLSGGNDYGTDDDDDFNPNIDITHNNDDLVDESDPSIMKNPNIGLKYVWTIKNPRLVGLSSTSGYSSTIFTRISQSREVNSEEYNKISSDIGFNGTFEISLSLLFTPCTSDSCVHGTCITQDGDIPSSSCECIYPYAGETCDEMGISYYFYIIQVILLVSTSTFTLSSFASLIYHLCDTDVYCVADFSFFSLHIIDILFSILSICSIILFHTPWSASVHSTIILICTGILIPPITTDATNPKNIYIIILIMLFIFIFSWLYESQFLFKICPNYCPSNRRNVCNQSVEKLKSNYHLASRDEEGIEMNLSNINNNAFDNNDNNDYNDNNDNNEDNDIIEKSPEIGKAWKKVNIDISIPNLQKNDNKYFLLLLNDIKYTFIGLFMSSLGLICFVFQTRLNYWYVHSLWHATVMLSAYFLIKGRNIFVYYINRFFHLPTDSTFKKNIGY